MTALFVVTSERTTVRNVELTTATVLKFVMTLPLTMVEFERAAVLPALGTAVVTSVTFATRNTDVVDGTERRRSR